MAAVENTIFAEEAAIATGDAAGIARGAALLRDGRIVAFATETVYGLGADARNGKAVARVYAVKGRPQFNPLIVHAGSLDEAALYGVFSTQASVLAERFWPGPLTLVVEQRVDAGLSSLVTAGLPTVALRVPDHEVALALIKASGAPVAAPSANRSGHVSATCAAHVATDLGGAVDLIMDSGPSRGGLESTIIDLSGEMPRLLRAGAIPREWIEDLVGPLEATGKHEALAAPGMLASHYAPRARLRLNVIDLQKAEPMLAFGPDLPSSGNVLNLSATGDLTEAAANLFAYLRALDSIGAASIAVMPIPATGLGEAINDRLKRAAAPRT